ncbi:Lon protease-1-like protein [Morus notabilis]|uniref:Lon protease-1-like protein n=1 Tax=Morus notabilis TaxID=981085 RepID=W9S0Y6_9ROSA|nr:Lon protease-1-like protein [Morus notabilis]
MLKLLSSSSSSCLQSRIHSLAPTGPRTGSGDSTATFLRVLSSLTALSRRGSNRSSRAFFCSDAKDGSEPASDAEVKEAESGNESKPSSVIVSTNPRPEDYLTVLALPLPHRPLFPGFYMPIYVKDPKLLAALQENRKRQAPYAGAFLLKDEPGTDPSLVSGSESEKNIYAMKGKELFNRLHEVGTLAQDKPYNKDDDVIKATSFEVISTLRDVLKTSSLWRDHVQTYTQV